jgi:hypothetical protein
LLSLSLSLSLWGLKETIFIKISFCFNFYSVKFLFLE